MHLHRGFGDADIVGNLLVQATGHDMEHDVTLAGAERVETFPEVSQCAFPLPTGTIASEAGLNGVKQILITERLCEELYSAALHRLHGHRHVGVRCDEDDRHLPVRSSKVALKLKTASPGILTSSTRQVGPSGGSALRKSGTDENSRVFSTTVRNNRATELRNSGSSSMSKTLGSALPIPGILR